MNELSATTTSARDAGRPVIDIVMGSDSDWPVMGAATGVLDEFKVAYEADVVSAHRMPTEMIDYGHAAAGRGLHIIIADAGGTAHLPGMLAVVTELPVIRVSVPLKHLDGMNSPLSIVQIPAEISVATVSIDGARNAGLLMVRIFTSGQGSEAARLGIATRAFQANLSKVVHARGTALREWLSH